MGISRITGLNEQRDGRTATPGRGERVKIVLVEWAAYPLYRNKVVDGRVVRCGLGRMLDSMRRHDPGLPVDVIVVINGAANEAKPSADAPAQPGLRGKLQQLVERQRQKRVEHRLRTYAELKSKYPFVEAVHFRDNEGQDFGAYDFGYQLLQQQGHDGDVLFMNSSVSGPHEHGWLLKYRGQFRRHPNVGLCGIALNSHDTSDGDGPFAPHVQSYFLYTNMKVLGHAIGPRLFSADVRDKLDVIRHGEIGVSERVLDAGYSITSSAFPEFAYRRGDPWAIPWGDLRYSRRLRLPVNTI
jgi:hypothetical protein